MQVFKRKLPLLLVVLVAFGLLFGGAVHSSLHEHDGGDCDVCHLTALPAVDAAPVVGATLPAVGGVVHLYERISIRVRRDSVAPRAPPVV